MPVDPLRPAPPSPVLMPGDIAPVHLLGLPFAPRVVVFLRRLGCPAARAGYQRLAGRERVVFVTPSRDGRDLPVLEDPDGALARAWRVGHDRFFFCTLRGWRVHPVGATLRVMRHGDALLSCFVLDGSVVVHAQHACHVADLPDPP